MNLYYDMFNRLFLLFIVLKRQLAFINTPPLFPETKNQWARDDPAFVVILCLFLVVATSAYCAA